MKKILIILSQPPYSSARAKEALDIALTSAAFEQEVSILFTQDAAYLLLDDQSPQGIEQKNLSNNLKALPMYDIDNLFIDEEALKARNMKANQIEASIEQVNKEQIANMIRDKDVVLRF